MLAHLKTMPRLQRTQGIESSYWISTHLFRLRKLVSSNQQFVEAHSHSWWGESQMVFISSLIGLKHSMKFKDPMPCVQSAFGKFNTYFFIAVWMFGLVSFESRRLSTWVTASCTLFMVFVRCEYGGGSSDPLLRWVGFRTHNNDVTSLHCGWADV